MLPTKEPSKLTPRFYILIAIASAMTALAFSLSPSAGIYGFRDIFLNIQEASIIKSLFSFFTIYLYMRTAKLLTKRLAIFAGSCGFLFGLCMVCGSSIKESGSLFGGVSISIPSLAAFFILLLGYSLFFASLIVLLFNWLDHRDHSGSIERSSLIKQNIDSVFFSNSPRSFFITVGFLLLVWIPYIIICFPGLASYDTIVEIIQGLGFISYSNHHPILHILFIEFFIKLGNGMFGSYLAGIAMAALLQVICGSVIYTYALRCLRRWGIAFGYRVFALLFFAFFPLVPIYSMTLWKDVWLAWSVLLFLLLIVDIRRKQIDFSKKKHFVLFTLSMFALVFSKNNGIIILLFALASLLLIAKGLRIRIASCALVVLVVFQVITGPVFSVLDISKGNPREAYSVPLLQMARVVRDNDEGISDEDKALIQNVLPYDELAERYNPEISDSIKGEFDTEAFRQDKLQYTLLWLRLGIQNPRLYVEAFLEHTYGYWFPDVQYWKMNTETYPMYVKSIMMNEPGLFPDFDPNTDTYSNYFPGPVFQLAESLRNGPIVNFPLTSPFFSIGFYFWVYLLCAFFLLYRKRPTELTPIVLLFALWLTCILSPVYAEFRYSLPAFVCIPIVIAVTFHTEARPSRSVESRRSGERQVPLPDKGKGHQAST